jgi:ABC-type branched-subunit amino acid transport system ATPase component
MWRRAEGQIGVLPIEQYLDFRLEVGDSFHIMDRGSFLQRDRFPIGTTKS